MPTPVQHLILAQRLLDDASLPEAIRDRLRAQRGAFLFGNTAPDVQTVSGQLREATHFFVIPWTRRARSRTKPCSNSIPTLASPGNATGGSRGFHRRLYLSLVARRVVGARHLPAQLRARRPLGHDLRDRHVFHNILRTWCDRHDQHQLNGTIGSALALAQPLKWLPFTADRYLIQWRDNLAEQFQPGASIRTVEVFAARNGVPPEKFHQVLDSPDEMEQHIFAHASREKIETVLSGRVRRRWPS